MSRQKQKKFAENAQRENVIQPGKELFDQIKGQWNQLYFKNQQPLVVELGCGRGEYTVGMARLTPESNFIGVDIKGDRIWKGSKTAVQESLDNVAFLRTQVQSLEEFFAPGEIDELWITFPDPRPKKRDIKRRMTHPRFLEIYRSLLRSGGQVHLKTDNQLFYEYTLEMVEETAGIKLLESISDLYQSSLLSPVLEITTHYEELFSSQGYSIKYLSFRFE